MSIIEIENEIKKLPRDKVQELITWLGNYHFDMWDKMIADDLNAGRLDELLAEVDNEIEVGIAKPL